MAKKATKSETLTIRMDPKTRFMLEFIARLRGQTITTVIERAISDAADRATIPSNEYGEERTWRDFWSVDEGERALSICAEPELRPTYEEERRIAFTRRFWPFFYRNQNLTIFRTEYLDVLWPQIDSLIETHDELKASNPHAAAVLMTDLLKGAKLHPPEWPPKPPNPLSNEEIPF